MNNPELPKPELTKVDSHMMRVLETITENQGVEEFRNVGDWIIKASDVELPTYLHRLTMRMDEAETFHDGVRFGMGISGIKQPFTVPAPVVERHVYDFHAFRECGESLHDAAVRLGFETIESDPEMVACVEYLLPRLGYGNEIVFTAGAGYGELFAELSVRDSFNAQSAALLDAQYGHELDLPTEYLQDLDD